MQMTFKKQIGKNIYTFIVEGSNLFELVQEAQKLGFYDVLKCGMCDSDRIDLRSYKTEKDQFEYVKISCAVCGGQVTFGKSKDKKDTFYLRKNEDKSIAWEKFEKKE